MSQDRFSSRGTRAPFEICCASTRPSSFISSSCFWKSVAIMDRWRCWNLTTRKMATNASTSTLNTAPMTYELVWSCADPAAE